MPDPIEAAMLEHGERLVVGANHPIVLSGNDAVYVRVGALDLFVQLVTATTVGKRRLVATAEPGAFIWRGPVLDDRPGWRVLGVGRPGTELLRLESSTVQSLVDERTLAERFEAFVASARPVGDGHGSSRTTPSGAGDRPAGDRLSDAQASFTDLVVRALDDALDVDVADAEVLSLEPQRARRRLDRALTDLVDVVDRSTASGTAPDDGQAQLDLALARVLGELGEVVGVEKFVFLDDDGFALAGTVYTKNALPFALRIGFEERHFYAAAEKGEQCAKNENHK